MIFKIEGTPLIEVVAGGLSVATACMFTNPLYYQSYITFILEIVLALLVYKSIAAFDDFHFLLWALTMKSNKYGRRQ